MINIAIGLGMLLSIIQWFKLLKCDLFMIIAILSAQSVLLLILSWDESGHQSRLEPARECQETRSCQSYDWTQLGGVALKTFLPSSQFPDATSLTHWLIFVSWLFFWGNVYYLYFEKKNKAEKEKEKRTKKN